MCWNDSNVVTRECTNDSVSMPLEDTQLPYSPYLNDPYYLIFLTESFSRKIIHPDMIHILDFIGIGMDEYHFF